jgi:predicted 3-demethylubiquinone-9 3-methyltransferase (glyoxalase superfamily)
MAGDGFITCLWFDGRAEEAADFYVSVFKNSRLGRTVTCTENGPGPTGSVLTVEFTANGQEFVALNGGPQFTFNEAVSFQVMCDDQEDVDHYWNRLTEGGGEHGPCGWLKDRFGVSWQVVPDLLTRLLADPDPERARKAMAALLKMKKLDVTEIQRAAAA